jgi:hypothetical protein
MRNSPRTLRRTQEFEMQAAFGGEIVDEQAFAAQEAVVLDAAERRAGRQPRRGAFVGFCTSPAGNRSPVGHVSLVRRFSGPRTLWQVNFDIGS